MSCSLAIWIPLSRGLMGPVLPADEAEGLKSPQHCSPGTQHVVGSGSLLQLFTRQHCITCLRVRNILLRCTHRILYRILGAFHFCSCFVHCDGNLSHDICIISKAVEITSPLPSDTIHQPTEMISAEWPLRTVIHGCSCLWNSWAFSFCFSLCSC